MLYMVKKGKMKSDRYILIDEMNIYEIYCSTFPCTKRENLIQHVITMFENNESKRFNQADKPYHQTGLFQKVVRLCRKRGEQSQYHSCAYWHLWDSLSTSIPLPL